MPYAISFFSKQTFVDLPTKVAGMLLRRLFQHLTEYRDAWSSRRRALEISAGE